MVFFPIIKYCIWQNSFNNSEEIHVSRVIYLLSTTYQYNFNYYLQNYNYHGLNLRKGQFMLIHNQTL